MPHKRRLGGRATLAGLGFGLRPLRWLVALALAGGDFPVDLGLLSLRPSVVATGVSFEAVDLLPGAIERVSHSPERSVAMPQPGAGRMITLLVELLVPLVGTLLAVVGAPFAVVGAPFAVVGKPLALLGDALRRIGKCFALVGGKVSFVCAMLLLAELAPQLLGTHSIRVGTPPAASNRRFLTSGRIPVIRRVVHGSSMRLAGASSNAQPPACSRLTTERAPTAAVEAAPLRLADVKRRPLWCSRGGLPRRA